MQQKRISRSEMKRLILVFAVAMVLGLIAVFVTLRPAFGSTRYIAQSSGTFKGGTACNGQTAITPTVFNWIRNSPGDVNYVCGTIIGSAGEQLLAPKGNGTPGNPVTIKFDTGAILEAPYFAPSPNGGCGGAICLYGLSYYTVDGQNTGTIENTDNGSSLSYRQSSEAIEGFNCTNCTIENLTIANIYVHSSQSDSAVDDTAVRCISISGSNWLIKNNTMHDAGWCLFNNFGDGDAHVEIAGNTVYNVNHGWMLASQVSGGSSGPFLFHGNKVYGYANWDTGGADKYHHDGIHCFTSNTGGKPAHYTAIAIYNNFFGGPMGQTRNLTSHVFMESAGGGTPCSDSSSPILIFNNIFTGDSGANDGYLSLYTTGMYSVLNNTFTTTDPPTDSSSVAVGGYDAGSNTNVKFENNVVSNFNQLFYAQKGAGYILDYNQYGNGGNLVCRGTFINLSSFSTWQNCIGGDSHSTYKSSIKLTSNYKPQYGSSLINEGINLTSLCSGYLAPLCSDYAGNPRPENGAWTVGAYTVSEPAPGQQGARSTN
jgi:hypothetical protein